MVIGNRLTMGWEGMGQIKVLKIFYELNELVVYRLAFESEHKDNLYKSV